MAYAVMGGLVFATLLTLVFLPALYVAWYRVKPADKPVEFEKFERLRESALSHL